MVTFDTVEYVVVLLCGCLYYSIYYMHMHAGAATLTCYALLNVYALQAHKSTRHGSKCNESNYAFADLCLCTHLSHKN